MKLTIALLTLAVGSLAASVSQAQVVTTYYAPAVVQPTTVYHAPAPVYAAPTLTIVTRPAPLPTVTYYAPPAVAQPVVAQPAVALPTASAVVYKPTVRVRTRYRPILGGTVTRVDSGYSRSVYPIVRY